MTVSLLHGQDKVLISPVEVIDTARLNKIAGLAAKEERSLKKVVRLMQDSCKTELERVYTIYTYIAGYYKYDLNRLKLIYKREIKRELYLSEVIKKKKGVCGDFSNLFATLCDSLDIGCYRVSGYSRNFNLFHPVRKNYYNHSWNVVRVDGNWYLLDVTFGMQHFTKKKFDKERIDYEFLFTDPITFGIRHLPADPGFQLVTRQRSYTDFRYHHFLWRISNTQETPPGDSILNKRLAKDWKDQLLEEAFAAQAFNKKVKGAGLKLLEVRINKVLDKKTKRKQLLKKQDYEDAIYLYQGLQHNLIENKGKKKYIRYTTYRILKLKQERDKLKK
ncbi:hypothetical protein FO442_14985 [Fluviicola chungangensis]|uniref:Transglutaminase-like domain-containing protein n=1 Tax=Fluviicola chungangensis TaxID=2597671 RepID=A0A556MMP2_9FLAO|nr:hypothetical protein FO442_14985 [Fluviicola chungangensis]